MGPQAQIMLCWIFRSVEVVRQVDQSIYDGVCLTYGVNDCAVPDVVSRERLHIESCDDAEIIAASLQCTEQVCVGILIRLNDSSVA